MLSQPQNGQNHVNPRQTAQRISFSNTQEFNYSTKVCSFRYNYITQLGEIVTGFTHFRISKHQSAFSEYWHMTTKQK